MFFVLLALTASLRAVLCLITMPRVLPTPTSRAPAVSAKGKKKCPGRTVLFNMNLGKRKWPTRSPLHVHSQPVLTAAVNEE